MKLAGFNAQGIPGVFKILVVCTDQQGNDQTAIRIDRIVNREGISVEEAKVEVSKREENDLAKWRKLYAKNDPNWVYFNTSYYDLVINTYDHNQQESLRLALSALKIV
jgi:cytidylate kinase